MDPQRQKVNHLILSISFISEKGSWGLLEKWFEWNPQMIKDQFKNAAGISTEIDSTKSSSPEAIRKSHFSPALGLSYDTPIHMASAAFQYMYDHQGNAYLDSYNNIPLVGHSHPKVSEAASRQIRTLNTNTRYHNDTLYRYADKLLSYFPDNLNKVFFVNSGTEANDLAQRLVRTHTQKVDRIVMEMGYHGHSSELINLSPYKYSGRGGNGKIESVCELPLPKEYNGTHVAAHVYLEEAKEIIAREMKDGKKFSSLLVEPISGCGGQVPIIDGYLRGLVPWLKERGVLTISDEVQIGFGRLGRWFWGFEMQEFLPDVVVIGKPMGNGFPLAGVVTTEAIANSFDNGMEFFSSFGGNPVSTAVGLSVLEVLEEEGLQNHATSVGDYYKKCLRQLQKSHPQIGDVRGEGLFIGVEFITKDGRPNGALCKKVKNQLKENFILTGSDGRFDEVLKIKPPLCFNQKNVDKVIGTMDRILKKV